MSHTRRPRSLSRCAVCLAVLVEACCHAFALPHPEGLVQAALNFAATAPDA